MVVNKRLLKKIAKFYRSDLDPKGKYLNVVNLRAAIESTQEGITLNRFLHEIRKRFKGQQYLENYGMIVYVPTNSQQSNTASKWLYNISQPPSHYVITEQGVICPECIAKEAKVKYEPFRFTDEHYMG